MRSAEHFRERLVALRTAKQLTREQLCSLSGVSYPTLHRYEAGKMAPRLDHLVRLAEALGVPLDDLVSEPTGE